MSRVVLLDILSGLYELKTQALCYMCQSTMYHWTKSLCNDYYLCIILPNFHMHTFRCYNFKMNDIYLKIWWGICACLYYMVLDSAIWVCINRKMLKLDQKVLRNISLLRNLESLKAIRGIRSHIQNLLQELLKTRVKSQNSYSTKLYWAWEGQGRDCMTCCYSRENELDDQKVPVFLNVCIKYPIISPCMVLN